MTTLHRIVLTGGPCAGKTTALAKLSERLRSLGFRVFLVPEAATLLIGGGLAFAGASPEQFFRFEGTLLRFQLDLERAFEEIARASGGPAVLICDRGAMDVAAYLPAATWQALLDEHGHSVVQLRDKRYEAVIHMVTAAIGAEKFYTTANNTARSESVEEARALDGKLHDAWVGHPHLRVIDNSTDFAGKMLRVVQALCRVVGVPEPVEIERKFLLRAAPADPLPVRSEEVEIEQRYLRTTDGSEARIRRRGQHGSYTYFHTVKRPVAAGQRVEVERPISAREYVALQSEVDPARRPVKKLRRCFLWKNHYFELDRFLDPRPGLVVLEAELESADAALDLPPFLDIEREVTADPSYSNFAIAGAAG